MTASIVRASSTRFKKFERPLRFCTTGSSFKCNNGIDGGINVEETMQSGIELIGIKGIKAEIELLSLLIEALKTIGFINRYETTFKKRKTDKVPFTHFERKRARSIQANVFLRYYCTGKIPSNHDTLLSILTKIRGC